MYRGSEDDFDGDTQAVPKGDKGQNIVKVQNIHIIFGNGTDTSPIH